MKFEIELPKPHNDPGTHWVVIPTSNVKHEVNYLNNSDLITLSFNIKQFPDVDLEYPYNDRHLLSELVEPKINVKYTINNIPTKARVTCIRGVENVGLEYSFTFKTNNK